jgi:transcriptional regulator with XRE-family HTH domain
LVAKKFSEKMKEERDRLDLSLEELAKQIGSTKSYVWELENRDLSRPSAEKIFKLAEVFGVSPQYLLDDTGRVSRNPDQALIAKFQKLSDQNKKLLGKFIDSLEKE